MDYAEAHSLLNLKRGILESFWDQNWRLSKRNLFGIGSAASWQVTYCMEYAEAHSLLTL